MGEIDVRPSGTVTFLFTDIVGSTRRWEADPESMRVELAAHDEVIRAVVEAEGGWLFKHTGDGVCAAFQSARAAVDAAVRAQRELGLPARMGIASGEAESRGDDYFGPTLNTAARVMAAGHGGQILLAASTASLVTGVDLVDLGQRSLRDLSAKVQLFQVRADGLGEVFPALRTVDVVPGNLPVQESSFVGRDDAIATVVGALDLHRVVSLIGVGGVGKTRLAVQAAAVVAPQFRDGVWLIELAPVTDGGGVDQAVATLFGLQPQPGRSWRQVVVDGLASREMLLVVDNCEHVLDETAVLVDALAACPAVSVLVTSRESLAVPAEWAWRVPSLTGDAAIELFIERADTAASGFRPDVNDRVVIGEICTRLDGIALAIELAAARVRSMSPTQIRDRLDERFRLLTGSRRSIERHQTLRHTVQWSYDLLEPVERSVLQQVSVFVGGFTLDAATAITGLDEYDVLDVVDSLVRKSLLHVDRSGDDVRYVMLEMIRQFAEEALAATDTSDATRDRRTQYFADRADEAGVRYLTDDELLAHRWVGAEIGNLSAAFDWACARGSVDAAVRLASNVHPISRNSLRTDTFDWPERILAAARRIDHPDLPRLLGEACDAATGTWRLDAAVRYGLEAIALNDNPRYRFCANAYFLAAMARIVAGDVEGSLQLVRTGAEHAADHPIRINLLFFLVLSSQVGIEIGEGETMVAIAQLSASPVPAVRAGGLWVHANFLAQQDAPRSIDLYQQAIDIAVACGSRTLEENCRSYQLELIARSASVEAALVGFDHVVDAWTNAVGDLYTQKGLNTLIAWLARNGYHRDAARLLGVLLRGDRVAWFNRPPEVLGLPDVLGTDEFSAAFEAGAAMDVQTATDLAREVLAQVRRDVTSG